MKSRQNVKSIFISDLHLGCKYSKSEQILSFLKTYEPENLFLVGDIIDTWRLSKRNYWEDNYNYIIRRIIGMMKHGCNVYYITGNHDDCIRKFAPNQFGKLKILNEFLYTATNGKKYLIIHGDLFDTYTMKHTWLYFLGDNAYNFSLWINFIYNSIRKKFGFKYYSLSQILKKNTKKTINFINDFENYISKYAQRNDCEGIICGHIHCPEIKKINNIEYLNCGDWVESCTAIIEHMNGDFEIKDFADFPPLTADELNEDYQSTNIFNIENWIK